MLIGDMLGPYRVLDKLGEGGMGQVFRARDTKLDRDVAIKVLPEAFAHDADRLARFTREAKTLASLNHPNIAGIYGLEECGPSTPSAGHAGSGQAPSTGSGQGGITALVMELVEGEDLSQRIARGAIPIDDALPIAKQIAEALEAAHEQGIIHRDLKPANIKVRADGTVKVLDFGLAKAMDPAAASSPEAMNSPTITSPAHLRQGYGAAGTEAGMILGTAAYMAPEQARGTAVDKRADVWAFGVVLYEMLTGQRLFAGATVSDTLAAVLTREPDWTTLPTGTPPAIRKLLRRCLEKDRKRRLTDAGAARLEIDDALTASPIGEGASAAGVPAATASSRGRLPLLAALAGMAALVAALAVPALRYLRQTPPPEMRLDIATPATDAPLQFALAPDGRSLAFVASGDGSPRLWLRPLDQTEARPLAGTEGGTSPFWSPDSRSIGFFAAGRLLRLDVDSGGPQVLATAAGFSSAGSWSADGTILFTQQVLTGPLWRVAATGGEPVAVTRLDPPRQIGHRHPQFLPGGRHFLFYAQGTPEAAGIYLGSLDGGAPTRLTASDSGGAFLPPDQVVFVRQGALVARRLDLAGRALTGDPITLADQVGVDTDYRAGFSVSGAGPVAYRAGGSAARQLTWVDRTGKAAGVAGEPDANDLQYPELSPDGRRVAIRRAVQGNTDLWLLDLVRGGMTRLTFDAALDAMPVWSPDGMRLAFSSNRAGVLDLYLTPSNGSGAEARLLDSPNTKVPQDWSRDGRWLLYYEVHPTTGRDLWAIDMTSPNRPSTRSASSGSTSSGRPEPVEGHTPRVVAHTPAEEVLAALSPDGRWVAYQTNESGRFEVVVQPFPDAGGKWQVSTAGGVAPRWRADSKELYFLAPDATLMAVPVTAAGTSFEAGTPVALFPTRIVGGGTVTINRAEYAVARDGRFLINQPVANAAAAPITLILNWNPKGTK